MPHSPPLPRPSRERSAQTPRVPLSGERFCVVFYGESALHDEAFARVAEKTRLEPGLRIESVEANGGLVEIVVRGDLAHFAETIHRIGLVMHESARP